MSTLMRHSVIRVPKPDQVAPEHEDEIFVRFGLHNGREEEPVMSFVIPVSDFLGWLYDIAADVRGIVQEDVLMSDQWPANLLNPN